MTIRKATEADLQAIADIYENIHTAEEKGETTIGWIRGVYPTKETARQSFLRGDLFVEEADGTIVGAAIINQQQVDSYKDGNWNYKAEDDQVMVLHTLVIDPGISGKGYGKEFVHFYEEYARENHCPYLRMDTNARNVRARAMYAKLGYSEIGIVPCVFNGIEGVQLVLLEKMIALETN